MENVSNLRGLQRQCVHVPCLIPSLCVCVYPHVREKLSVGETYHLYEMGKRKKQEDRIRERTEKQGEVGMYQGV